MNFPTIFHEKIICRTGMDFRRCVGVGDGDGSGLVITSSSPLIDLVNIDNRQKEGQIWNKKRKMQAKFQNCFQWYTRAGSADRATRVQTLHHQKL